MDADLTIRYSDERLCEIVGRLQKVPPGARFG